MEKKNLMSLTADVVSAHVGNNKVAIGDLGTLIQGTYAAFAALEKLPAPEQERRKKALSARESITSDYLVCLECGSRQKMMKRHLSAAHKLTPAKYRANHDLPSTYPMVAANCSKQRRALAHSTGFGRKSPTRRRRTAGADSASAEQGGGIERAT
jgi:predicted transcriptional regulator